MSQEPTSADRERDTVFRRGVSRSKKESKSERMTMMMLFFLSSVKQISIINTVDIQSMLQSENLAQRQCDRKVREKDPRLQRKVKPPT